MLTLEEMMLTKCVALKGMVERHIVLVLTLPLDYRK